MNRCYIDRKKELGRGRSPLTRTPFKTKQRGDKKCRKVGLSNSVYRPKHAPGTRKRLIENLDTACSLIVRHRDGWRCFICGSAEEPQAGHLFTRKRHATRWELEAIYCSCSPCNKRHNTNPDPMYFAVVRAVGSERFAELRDLSHSKKRFSDAELMTMLEDRREHLRRMPKTHREAA